MSQDYAVVTGASSGIGRVFAQRLAARGTPLILVARRKELLQSLAMELPVPCVVVPADLSTRAGCDAVEQAAREAGASVGLLVHCAGYGLLGRFETLDPDDMLAMTELSCRAVVDLTRRFLPGMLAAGRGGLVFVSSLAAFQGAPFMSTYGGGKAFQLNFAEGLHQELRGRGVDVLCVCPGPVRTRFGDRAGVTVFRGESTYLAPERVVDRALAALGRRPVLVMGWWPWMSAFLGRFVPRSLSAWVSGQVARRLRPGL